MVTRDELLEAVRLARLDWDQGLDDERANTEHQAALSIRASLFMPRTEAERNWTWAWQDHGDAQSAAYRLVLEATDAEIDALREPA